MGNSIDDIKKYCKNANVYSGLAIQGSYVSTARDIVNNWIKI